MGSEYIVVLGDRFIEMVIGVFKIGSGGVVSRRLDGNYEFYRIYSISFIGLVYFVDN